MPTPPCNLTPCLEHIRTNFAKNSSCGPPLASVFLVVIPPMRSSRFEVLDCRQLVASHSNAPTTQKSLDTREAQSLIWVCQLDPS